MIQRQVFVGVFDFARASGGPEPQARKAEKRGDDPEGGDRPARMRIDGKPEGSASADVARTRPAKAPATGAIPT